MVEADQVLEEKNINPHVQNVLQTHTYVCMYTKHSETSLIKHSMGLDKVSD